ncbi:TIGR02452 family protein [Actinomadura sp. HBU206391]|uniref:TIGR02452 family protein n=1 Tax=Actinomadura sp. HBU206391 TaxID=2731692 RepID=UPI00164F7E6A|nr:TIGR02452 family protein [Actinomadura sp. HBU206391]MBC6459994.1 TIGR02452 family protein [Actinomadura sp. HBU206391]
MSRHPRRAIAQHTVEILEQGSYATPSGRTVDVSARLARAVDGTRVYRPAELNTLLSRPSSSPALPTMIEVTGETTLAAARRLSGLPDDEVACLNFASAKNPGGGFLNGAHAQEEGLARSSGLYASLRAGREFYDFHRAQGDLLYSDHMIYSPGVPVFRDDSGELLEEPYDVAFLTSPAPNRGAIRDPAAADRIPEVLALRAAKLLAMAEANGHRRLVLGAWGCGVFRNDPAEVAEAFAGQLLGGGQFTGRFGHVVFAVYDTVPGEPRLAAFRRTFA